MVENRTVEPCVYCDNPDGRSLVILSSFGSSTKHSDQAMDSIGRTCLACGRSFSTSIHRVVWRNPQIRTSEEAFCRDSRTLQSELPNHEQSASDFSRQIK